MKREAECKLCAIAVHAAFWTCFLILTAAPSAAATDGAAAGTAQDDSPLLGEIIVTAERRSELLQKVPISITALTGEDMEKSRIDSISDVQQHVPGLTVTKASTGQAQVFIRGIGTDIVGSGVEGAVAVYVDGVYQSRAAATAMQFIDVDRIEVLKGPQGTLYGRNATGGVINILSKAPGSEKTAQFDAQAGSDNQLVIRGTISGPLLENSVNGRLSFLHNSDDGDTRNVLLNRRANSNDVNALRGSLVFLPDNKLLVTVNAHYYQDNFTTAFKPLHPSVNPLFTVFGATQIADPRTVMQNVPNEATLTQDGVDVKAEFDLETMQLMSLTALHQTDYNIKRADLDGTEVPLISVGSAATGFGIPETTKFLSQEFTLTSNTDSPLVWTGLLSYTHQKVDAPGFNFEFPLLGLTTNSVATVSTDALSVGGEGAYSWANGLRLTLGARYSSETKNLEKHLTHANGVLTGSMSDKKTWSSVTPRLVIDYSPNGNTMLYASATKGFKSGGYNTVAIQPAFSPETAINYEAGVKSRLLDDRLLLNLAAFHTKYNDMQVAVVRNGAGGLFSEVENAARATSKGIEASVAAKPGSRFELSGGLQLLKARFDEFVSIDPRYPAQGALDQRGNPLSRAPDLTANAAAQYSWPTAQGRVTLRGEGSYRSRIYFTPFRNDYASEAGLTVWNALLSYEPAGKSGVYGTAYVKNLGNKTYTSTIFDPQGLGYLAYYAPGRALGIQVGYKY